MSARGGARSPSRALVAMAVLAWASGCAWFPSAPPPANTAAMPVPAAPPAASLSPSPRLIVGRVLSVDHAQRLATIDLQSDAPAAALEPGAELIARDYSTLAQTGLLRASRYVRGRTLGATIESGQPAAGDEVVWLAP